VRICRCCTSRRPSSQASPRGPHSTSTGFFKAFRACYWQVARLTVLSIIFLAQRYLWLTFKCECPHGVYTISL
ncbi:hypothetical protein M405DRAFT_805760, partial [Rhizopogon salebrosus TDB-379]